VTNTAALSSNRSVLACARVRLSPQTQPIREAAIDRMVQQVLVNHAPGTGVTAHELQRSDMLRVTGPASALTLTDVEHSLDRLASANKVHVEGKHRLRRYRLTTIAEEDVRAVVSAVELRLERATAKLFSTEAGSQAKYGPAFLDCLSTVFARLGEAYVRLIIGDLTPDTIARFPLIHNAILAALRQHKDVDPDTFTCAVHRFFREPDPDFDLVKWNLAQSYYIAQAIGLDPSGVTLSRDAFGDSVVYLDTNVLMEGLGETAPHFASFETLIQACSKLGMRICVCRVSVDEMRHVVAGMRELFSKIAEQVPADTVSKVGDHFFQMYMQEVRRGGPVQFDHLFSAYLNPSPILRDGFGIEIVDSEWFDSMARSDEIRDTVTTIQRLYSSRTGREKRERAAMHDALLLQYVERERTDGSARTWVVTLDQSLPLYRNSAQPGRARTVAISLDALVQWISPAVIAAGDGDEESLAQVFANAIRYSLLPQETFFDVHDFLVFAEMEWSCKELPAEDVEGCIRYLREHAPELDPSNPTDRERMQLQISRFFADPGRKYKQELARTEEKLVLAKQAGEQQIRIAKEELRQKHEELREFQQEVEQAATARRSERLRNEAVLRIVGITICDLLLLWLVDQLLMIAAPAVQQRTGSYPVFLSIFGLIAPATWVLVGKERLQELWWPLRKILGVDK